ncbi:hypothetical protein CBS101457_000027 [Exobasidium rhododendri]|nr:hypothetical protein CBS101457_000027 [Exobasidium rhododendri]
MEYFKETFDWEAQKAVKPLRIIIIGAGIGGLATALGLHKTGHHVTVLERVADIKEVGAGIQLAPNAARVLARFGVLEKLLEDATLLEKNSLRRYEDDKELGSAPLMPGIGKKYGAPLSVIHRGDLLRELLKAVKDAGVDVKTKHHVVEADENFEARVKTDSGEWFEGDLIIAGDGVKSTIRAQMAKHHGVVDHSVSTGDSAYRLLIPRDSLKGDERALKLLNENVGMRWMGPGGHIMAYPIKRNQVYNMVLLHPIKKGQSPEDSWTTKGDRQEMLDMYSKWSSLVRDLISYCPEGEIKEWALNSHAALPSWHENKVVLIGDACHPMLPYVAQGAANAIEDAGALAAAFTKTSDVTQALEVYEEVRKTRAETIQQSASSTRKSLHLPDGPQQQKRDLAIANAGKGQGHNPDMWADSEFQDFMWGVDIMKDICQNWDSLLAKVEKNHVHNISATSYT